MDSDQERMKAQLMARISKKLDKVLETKTVTMSDIENIVAEFQREAGQEIVEGVLDLKKTPWKKV
jgi:cell division protein FtsX